MAIPVVRLKIRVRLDDGSRPYVDPFYSGNGKLKPLWAVIDGKEQHRREGVYYLRYLHGKKRIFERVGSDAQLALAAQVRREKSLGARSFGLVIADNLLPASSDKPQRPSGPTQPVGPPPACTQACNAPASTSSSSLPLRIGTAR